MDRCGEDDSVNEKEVLSLGETDTVLVSDAALVRLTDDEAERIAVLLMERVFDQEGLCESDREPEDD